MKVSDLMDDENKKKKKTVKVSDLMSASPSTKSFVSSVRDSYKASTEITPAVSQILAVENLWNRGSNPVQTHRDLGSIQTDLTAAKRDRSGLLNDPGFAQIDLSEFRTKLDTANQNVNRYKSEKLIEDKVYQTGARADTFGGQFSANKTMGRLTQNQSRAWNEYLKNPTRENRKTAESYDKAIKDFAEKNKIALDDENVRLSIISQSYANYLPQQVDQLKAQAPGAIIGGAAGLLIGNPIAGAKIGASISSGADMFEITRGAAFKRLIDLGIDEETARAMATDEGIVHGLIEGGDTYLDWTLFGGKARATKLLPSLSAKASTAAGMSALAKVLKQLGGKVDNLPTTVKVAVAYGVNIPQEGLEEGSQEVVSLANDQRVKTGETGVLNLMKNSFGLGKDLLTGTDYVVGYDQNFKPILASEQVKEAAKEGMKIAVVAGGMQAIGGYAAQRALTPKPVKGDNKNTPAPVSPAASPEVQQAQAQAEVVQAQNPEANVLDAATTLFVNEQGCNLKTAQTRAEIVQKLVAGENVSDKVLKRIEPTSKITQRIFTQLTGVQFPEGALGMEAVLPIFRSAHDVAVKAQAVKAPAAPVVPVAPVTETGVVEPEVQAQTAPEAEVVSLEDFVAYAQQFPEMANQAPEALEVAYAQFLQDTGMRVEMGGKQLSFAEFVSALRSAPDGDKLTVGEAGIMFQQMAQRQNMTKEANNGRQQESGQSPVQYDGQSGQPGERTGMAAAGLDQGTGSQEGAGSQGNGADARGYGEVSRGPVNPDAVSADGETNFMEIHEEAWSDEMRAQTPKFKRAGITLRSALGPIPIPGTTRACDGVSHLGVESIVQSDSPFFSFEQLCDHEVGHQYFFRDPALYQKCAREFRLRTSKAQRAELMKSYLGSYADVYAQKTAKEQAKIQAAITEEIICDAFAGMNRNGANADQLQEFIKPIIDEWCAARDAELESAEKRYSIDSMAEAVGLTFEKDGQMTVFKDGSGNRVDEVTEKMVQTSPLGAVIQSAVDKKFITDADAEKQITFFTELYNLMLKTQDIDLLWAVSSSIGFQPIEAGPRDPASLNQKSKFAGYTKNSDPQYSTTVDFTTICLKTQAVIDAMSATMMELGHGLTEDEIVNIVYRNTHDAGEPVPCPVCYVFSRWVGLGGLFDNMNNLQTQYANADLEVLRADIETLSQRIDEIMVKRGYALATGKGGSKSYVLPNSSTKKSFGDAKIVMEKELMARQLELQAKQNQDMVSGKKTMTKAEESELAALKRDIQILDNWTWLTDVRLSENYAPVPPEILFDINAGKEFAERYPESWKFRTTRGPAMGKAATPYADEHLGQILRGAGASDLKKAELGDPAKNPFLKSKNGKLTPAAEKALQKSIAKIKAQNLLNGQRYQSTSDFRFEYALDYLLSFVEMQALGGKVQLYTKVAEAVRMFASIGAEVNCSLMPLGIGYRVNKDGSKTLTFSSVTGMNAEDAFNLSNEFDNVQPIMVGIGNEHIRLCMADDRITFIIPYHASGAGEARYVALMDIVGEHVEEREDYSNYQTDHKIEEPTKAQKAAYDLRLKLLTGKLGILSDADKQVLRDNEILHNLYKRFYGKDMDGNISDIDPKYLNPEARNSGKLFRDNECYGAFLTSEQAKNVMPFEYWDRTSTIDQADLNGQAFVEYCESLGLRPRFSGWDGNGVYHAEFDFSKESGYWKMLIDRSVYNRDGSYHEQQAINVTNFNAGFLLREESVKGIVQPSLVNDPAKTEKIAQKSADQVREKRGEKKFSVFEKADPETVEASDILTRYSIREDDPPKNVIRNVYKAFYARDGKLYPPMVANLTEDEMKTALRGGVSGTMKSLDTPVGVWLDADIGKLATDADGNPLRNTKGRLAVVNEKGGGTLAFRPGWHLGEWPDAKQFNKDSSVYGPKSVMPDGLVFARCEIAADIDYQLDAMSLGMGENGKFNRTQAGLPMVPVDGYYKYRTNVDPNTAPWYITGAMRVVEILDDEDCAKICAEFGVKPSPRQSGKPINLADYGLKRGPVEPTKDVSAYKKTDAIRRNTEALKAALNAEGYENSYVSRPINFDDAEIRKEFDRNRQNPDEYREKAKNWSPLQVRDTSATKRYSVIDGVEYVDVSSDGQLLTKEQDKYFEKSKARDYLGRLMTMFHGTRSFGFTVFDPEFSDDGISLFFTDRPSTSRTYTGTKENDIRALSKDTDMSKYEHDGEFGNNDEAWKYLEQSGYKRVVDAMTPDQVRGAFESVVEIDVEEATTWLEALETELPKILNERRWTVAQNNSIRRLKDAIAEVEDLRGKPDYDSDLYFDVVSGAMTELFEAELAIMDNLEWYREDVRTVEGWDVLEGLSEAISEPGYAKRHWDRLNDAYFEAVHYESPVHLVFSPTEGMFHLSDEALHSEARRVWRDNQRGLYEVYLNLENPLIIDANENNWNDLDYADLSDVEANENTYWEGSDTRSIAEWAKENGYDGVIVRNVYDHGRYRTGDESAATVMIAFKSEQVKSTANQNPTTNPDIRYSVLPNLTFEEQVDRVAAGTLDEALAGGDNRVGAQHSAVYVRNAPTRMMIDLGYGNLAVLTTQDHVTSGMAQREDADGNIVNIHAHQLTPEQIKKVPEILQRPVMVMQAKGRPESMVFVSDELDYAGRPIIVAVKANGTDIVYDGKLGPAHLITSFYGRNGFESFVRTAVNEGRIAYYDPAKLNSLFEKLPENKGRSNSSPTTPGYHSSGQLMSGIAPEQILMKVQPKVKNPGQRKYSITPQFEKWYKETYGEDLTSSQLKRRLQTAERRAEEAEHDRKAAELKNTIDSQMNLTAWMMHHTKKMREQKRTMNEKLAEARKEKTAAVRAAVAETKEIERAKAEVQHDADRMAERRAAAKRLRTREDAYKQKVTEIRENHKLKRNAAKATLRDSKLAAKKRAEIEAEQGLVNTIRQNPKQRSGVEKLQNAGEALRTLGRTAYRNFVNMAEAIDRFSKRQAEGMRAGTLVNILGGCTSTVERCFKEGLVDRSGNRIGDSMSDVFLCWDEAHKTVSEERQALLQDFMLHRHNIDRMSIVARAESALETFENTHEWLRDMDTKEFARLVAMTEKEVEKTGKYEAQQQAFEYARLLRAYNEAQNKPIFADDKGNPVTAETSQKMVDKYLAEQPWLLEKANGIYEWWDLFMRNWAVGDTVSEAEYARMRQMYPHYVPTYRTSHEGVGGAGFVGNGAASVSKAVKKAKGSTEEVMNIEDSFSKMVGKIIRLNRLNEMYMNIVDTAMLDDDGVFADMAYFDWDSSWQSGEYANALREDAWLNGDLEDAVDDAETLGLEKVGNDYKLTGWKDGRKYTAFISEDLYKSIGMVTGHLTNDLEEGLLKVGNALTGPMKTAITGINPTFAVRNLSRDLPTAIINSVSGMAFPKYWAQAAKEIAQNSERWQQFQALGGTHATYYNDSQGWAKAMSKGKNIGSKALGAMGAFNEVTESQTRFAEYLATIDRLGDTYENRLQGIKNSAEVTVDFSRKGRYGKVINAWVPYWNPAVQGIDKTVRSVIDSPDGSAIWKQASKTLGRAAMTTVLFEAILYGFLKARDRDDEWEELNDRTKDTYYCIPLKDSKTFLKIPKNREWGAILGTPFMRMLEYANGRENPFENYIETAIEPNFLPPAIFRPDSGGGFSSDIVGIAQALDLAKNEDFAGSTIVPYAYQQGTLTEQYDNETSKFSIALGKLINWSPMQIDYILGDYFGDFGRMFIQATSDATLTGEQDLGKAALDIVTSPFVADARYSNYAVSKYYDTLNDLDRVVQDRKNQLGTDEAKKTIEYQTQKALNELYGKAITELNREVREMPDGKEKDALKSQIAELAEEAMEFYNDSISGKIENPELTAAYVNQSKAVADELIRMDGQTGEYNFKPRTSAPKSYVDPDNKGREYILTEEQQEYFMELYREEYNRVFEHLIKSSKYKNAKDTRKAEMLEDAKQDVQDAAKEQLFSWLKRNGVRSTPKK